MSISNCDIRHLSDVELLEIFFGVAAESLYQNSSRCLQGAINEAAPRDSWGSFALRAAQELTTRALHQEIKGCCFDSPRAAASYLTLHCAGLEHEVFLMLSLDAQHCLIQADEIFRGTVNQTSVYPREVVKLALRRNAVAVVFAHNHPSGMTEPSHADIRLTQDLKAALSMVDVRVLDHLVVGGAKCRSMADSGLI